MVLIYADIITVSFSFLQFKMHSYLSLCSRTLYFHRKISIEAKTFRSNSLWSLNGLKTVGYSITSVKSTFTRLIERVGYLLCFTNTKVIEHNSYFRYSQFLLSTVKFLSRSFYIKWQNLVLCSFKLYFKSQTDWIKKTQITSCIIDHELCLLNELEHCTFFRHFSTYTWLTADGIVTNMINSG